MGKVVVDVTMSLDGFIAGPSPSLEEPLGAGGECLHEWLFGLKSFRERHGREGGEANRDSDLLEESFRSTGAVVMGRRMFSGGEGGWTDDPNAAGWWGDEPPFRVPVFVLTHHERSTVTMKGGTSFTFVTSDPEHALAVAREAAGDKDVSVAGGASTIQQFLRAGLVDELQLHVAPMLLGSGTRLFEGLGPDDVRLEALRTVDSPRVTHVKFRVVR